MLGKMLDRGPVSININIHIVLYFFTAIIVYSRCVYRLCVLER